MKKLLMFIFILFTACSMPQSTPLPPEQAKIQQIIVINNTQKTLLYNRAKMWVVENFVSAKDVIDYDNAQQGIIVAKGNIKYPCPYANDSSLDSALKCNAFQSWRIKFMMKIEIKNSKVRVTINNIRTYFPPTVGALNTRIGGDIPVRSVESMNLIKPSLLKLINDFKLYMTNQSQTNSNW